MERPVAALGTAGESRRCGALAEDCDNFCCKT